MNLLRTIRRRQAAYTMVELMVAMLISVVLVVAMYQIFARVQSVFTTGHGRTKLLEEGRAVMDLIVRDLGRMAPAGMLEPNFIANEYQTIRIETLGYPTNWTTLRADQQNTWLTTTEPFVSSRVSFLGHDDQWQKMAYRLESRGQPGKANDVIGALWRYESKPIPKRHIIRLGSSNRDGEYQKLSDNVVHFRMRAVSPHDPGRALWVNPEFRFHTLPLYVEVEIGLIEEKLKKEILNDGDVERWAVELENILSGNPSVGRGRQMDEDGDGRISPKEFLGPKHLFDQFDTNKDKFLSISRAVYAMRHARVMKLLNDNLGRILMLRQLVPIRRQADISPALFVKKTPKEFINSGFAESRPVIGRSLAGMPVKDTKYVFIIDKSYSMSKEGAFEIAKKALVGILGKIDSKPNEKVYFYIIFTNIWAIGMPSNPDDINSAPSFLWVECKSPLKKNYQEWVKKFEHDKDPAPTKESPPDPEQAVRAAFFMEPDAIWLVTDDIMPEKIFNLIRNLNEQSTVKVRVNTVGIGRFNRINRNYLSQIAVDNEGVYTFVSTDPEEEE